MGKMERKYFFSVEYRNGDFKIIDSMPFLLNELDEFTFELNGQAALKQYLLSKNMITKYDMAFTIRIRDDKSFIVPNKIAFESDKEYFDISYLKSYIYKLFYDNDLNFLNNIAKYFRVDVDTSDIYNYVNSYNQDLQYGYDGELSRDEIFSNFFNKMVYKRGQFDYYMFRKLAIYVSRYAHEFILYYPKKEENQMDSKKLTPVLVKKKKANDKENKERQLSFL